MNAREIRTAGPPGPRLSRADAPRADHRARAPGTDVPHRGHSDQPDEVTGPDDPDGFDAPHGPGAPATPAVRADRLTRLAGTRLAPLPGTALLVIGCGTGRAALLLAAETGCTVTGTDIGATRIATARRRAARSALAVRPEFHTADPTALPFPAGSFDQALMMEVTTRLPDTPGRRGKRAVLAEAARCLRPGGLLLLADPVGAGGTPPGAPGARLTTRERLPALLDAAGFDVLRIDDLTALTGEPATAERYPGYVMITAWSRAARVT
ncbi:class I SAM-dependent methyltransferase [Streptomyces sp. NPDC088124]|uniref:class I SAM-dependent methyltransferase n=1 Tax=Streptomyces sp. NPDC088124 TaxID=3154654 RepID=UPI003439C564